MSSDALDGTPGFESDELRAERDRHWATNAAQCVPELIGTPRPSRDQKLRASMDRVWAQWEPGLRYLAGR